MTRNQLIDALSRLLPAQFDSLVDKLAIPRQFLSGAQVPSATRAHEILQWAEQRDGIAELERALGQVVACGASRAAGDDSRGSNAGLESTSIGARVAPEVARIIANALVKCALIAAVAGIGGELLRTLGPLVQPFAWVLASALSVILTRRELKSYGEVGTTGVAHSRLTGVLSLKASAVVVPALVGAASVVVANGSGRFVSHLRGAGGAKGASAVHEGATATQLDTEAPLLPNSGASAPLGSDFVQSAKDAGTHDNEAEFDGGAPRRVDRDISSGPASSTRPEKRVGLTQESGRLPPETISRIVNQNFGRFRLCYENGLRNNPNLQGMVSVRFVINRDGSVSNVSNGGSDMPDGGVVSCTVRAFYGLSFPPPEGGIVRVNYPIMMNAEFSNSKLSSEPILQVVRDRDGNIVELRGATPASDAGAPPVPTSIVPPNRAAPTRGAIRPVD